MVRHSSGTVGGIVTTSFPGDVHGEPEKVISLQPALEAGDPIIKGLFNGAHILIIGLRGGKWINGPELDRGLRTEDLHAGITLIRKYPNCFRLSSILE